MDFFTTHLQNGVPVSIPINIVENYFSAIPKRFRLQLIARGNGWVYLNQQKFPFVAPCVICSNDELKNIQFESNSSVIMREMVFHPLIINPDYGKVDPEVMWIQAFNKNDIQNPAVYTIDYLTLQRFESIFTSLKMALEKPQNDHWICRARSYLIEALLLMDRLRLQSVMSESNEWEMLNGSVHHPSEWTESVIHYCHLHYNETVSLEQLCQLFHVNRTSLNKSFKEAVGKSVMQYLIELRVHTAKILLMSTQLSIYEIMERVGFSDPAHFNRMFKQKTGLTPAKYREQYT